MPSKETNRHRVDKKVWAKWPEHSRAVFNSLYEDIMQIGPDLFLHPKTVSRSISADEFKTIAWNAAWLAADHVKEPGHTTNVETVEAA